MVFLSLKPKIFREVHMTINLGDRSQLDIESAFSFNVNYNEDSTLCTAVLRQEVKEKSDQTVFNIVVEGIGNFLCEGIDDDNGKREAHLQAYTQLFPYVQNMICRLIVSAGLPPLMIERAKMSADDVKIGT